MKTDKSQLKTDTTVRRRNRPRSTPVPVKNAIRRLVLLERHRNKTEIYRELERTPELQGLILAGKLPSPKTVGREVDDALAEFGDRDLSGTWSMLDREPEDARPVLAVLAEVIRRTGGRTTSLTRSEARLIARIHQAAPGLGPGEVWHLAILYVMREASRRPTADLDAYLAFRCAGESLDLYRFILEELRFDQPSYGDDMLRLLGDIPPDIQRIPVSNPVSNDARSATDRGRPKRPSTNTRQDMTDGGE